MSKVIDVVGAVFVRDGQVFAARRGFDKAQPGMWEFPGGKIEDGETPQQALVRELQEELHVNAAVHNEITTTSHTYGFGTVNLTTFYCELIDGTTAADMVLEEHSEARWVDIAELLELDWAPADIPAVKLVMGTSTKGVQ